MNSLSAHPEPGIGAVPRGTGRVSSASRGVRIPPAALPALYGGVPPNLSALSRARDAEGTVRLRVPYSIANVGPGFDRFGLCLDAIEDVLEFEPRRSGGLSVEVEGDPTLSTVPALNAASAALTASFEGAGKVASGTLRIRKGFPGGSGIGSSGASAVGGALAGAISLGRSLDSDASLREILRCAAEGGERAAAGTAHYDNVVASLAGAFTFLESVDPLVALRIVPPPRLRVAVAVPVRPLATRLARSVLPVRVPLTDVSENIGRACSLVHGLLTGNLEQAGRGLSDRIAEPYRAHLVPGFVEACRAARHAGAWGAGLAGSGPAVFAFCAEERVSKVLEALAAPLAQAGEDPRTFSSGVGTGPGPVVGS